MGVSLNEMMATPLLWSALIAGAVAAFAVVAIVLVLRRGEAGGVTRILLTLVGIGTVAVAAAAVLDRLALDDEAAERRALLARIMQVEAGAFASGTALACLDGAAGEALEKACEGVVFASPQSAAAAVALTGARLALLVDTADAGDDDTGIAAAMAGIRRALERDRFGLTAHVLALRDGCTADRCETFARLRDTAVLKTNLRAQPFEFYVERHAATWNKSQQPVAEQTPASAAPVASAAPSAPAPVAGIAEPASPERIATGRNNVPKTVIPPVSIMDTEPPVSKEAAAAQAAAPASTDPSAPRLPQPRPQAATAPPPAR